MVIFAGKASMPIDSNIVANPQKHVRFFNENRLPQCGRTDGTSFPFSEIKTREGWNQVMSSRVRDNHNYNNYIIMFVLCGSVFSSLYRCLSTNYERKARNLRNEKRVFYDFWGTIARNLRRNSEFFTKIPQKRVFYDFSAVFCRKSPNLSRVLAFFAENSGQAENRKASFLRFFLTKSEFFTISELAYAQRV